MNGITYTNIPGAKWSVFEKETNEHMEAKKTLKFHRSQDLLFQSNFLLVELFYPLKMH